MSNGKEFNNIVSSVSSISDVRSEIHDYMYYYLKNPSIPADVLVPSVIGKLASLCYSHDSVSCSAGSWFFDLLPYCEGYLGCDVSKKVLDRYFSLFSDTPKIV